MDITFILEAIVVLAAIVMGTRAGGVGVGVWGGLGVAVLVFVFREAPGEPPISALLIILAVVTAAALMQVAGGVDWMVKIAANVIQSRPKQITYLAPLAAFLFSVGAGTSNILYPLLPVIYDVSYQNNIRPSRPLTVSVVQSGMSLAASPVSAAMAAMVTLTAVEPYNFDLIQILSITFPAAVVGILVTSFFVGRMWPDLDEDPEVQELIASGKLARPGTGGEKIVLEATKEGRNSAIVFLLGVLAIVIFGLFPDLRPAFDVEGELVPIDMTTTIQIVMFTVGVLILLVGKPKVSEVPKASVFQAGMISAIALFGIAWLTATFILAHEEFIVTTIGGWVSNAVWIFAIAVFLVAALTTSQSTATRTIVPIGLAAGLAPGLVTGMWAGSLGGVYTLPANGTQIAAANFDLTGGTKLGTKLLDHSFFIPMLIMTVTSVVVGALLGVIFYGT
jgi:anaerobic C4-dicarboxylate transporter DcuA/anaerobic C4-dicarboxylate transporter DcuB